MGISIAFLVATIHDLTGEVITVISTENGDDKDVENEIPLKPMFNPVQLLPGAISEILASVAETGILTLSDRYGLLAATLDENLPDEERLAVNRLLRSIQRGRVQVGF